MEQTRSQTLPTRFWTRRRLSGLLMGVLILVGLGLRLPGLEWMLYDFDEGVASIYALQWTAGGIWPEVGVRTSFGFYNPPLFIHAISPGFVLHRDPVVAVGWLQILTVGAHLLLWRELRMQRLGAFSATVAVICLLAAPGPILYGRRLWGHALIPTLGAISATLVLRLTRRPADRWASLFLPLAISAAQQVHFSGALFLPTAILSLILLRGRVRWAWLATGCAIAGMTYIPWLLHDSRQGWQDVRMILGLMSRGSSLPVDRSAFQWAWATTLFDFSDNTAMQRNAPAFFRTLWLDGVGRGLAWALLVLGSCLTIASWVKLRVRTGCHRVLTLGWVCLMIPGLVFGAILKVPAVPAYALAVWPGPGLLVAGLITFPWSVRRRRWYGPTRLMASIVCLILVLGSSELLFRTHQAMAQADPQLIHYPAWRDTREAARTIAQVTSGSPTVILSQEQLSPERGMDYQMLYALTLAEGNGTRYQPRANPATSARVIIHNRARGTLVGLADPLNPWTVVRVGLLEVSYRLPRPPAGPLGP